MLGLLLVAMFAAFAMSATLYLLSAPLWQILLAYPLTGALVLFVGILLPHILPEKWFVGVRPSVFPKLASGSPKDDAHSSEEHPKIGHK